MKIGFIGLGIMGSRMAANLQQHDYELVVFNRTPDKATPLTDKGAGWADTPAAVAGQVDILLTMLAHPQAVSDMALGEEGFLTGLRAGTLWVDCSTVNPSFSRQMAAEARARQLRFVDAPVAGSKNQAAQAELIFIAGGPEADVETCRPLFEVMGSRVVHVGEEPGQGVSLKIVFNMLLAASMAAFAEGMALGQSLGLPQEMLLNVLLDSPVVPAFVTGKRDRIEQGDYDEADFPLKWMQKDLQMAATTAYETGAALPLANVAKEVYQLAARQGLGDKDFSAIYRFLEDEAGQ